VNTFSRIRRAVAFASAPILIASLDATPAMSEIETSLLAVVEAAFPAWDLDADGKLTPIELDLALASSAVGGDAAAAAAALRRASRARPEEIKYFTLPEFPSLVSNLSFKDARENQEPRETAASPSEASTTLLRYFREARRRIADAPAALFSGPPDATTLKQGRLGSCFSLAPLLALGISDPAALSDRFDPQPDGSVHVRFGLDRIIVVPPLTDGELAQATTTADQGRWAAVYEKGAGILRLQDRPPTGPATPHSAVTRGGSAGAMLATFTGQDIRRFTCRDWLPGKQIPTEVLAQKLDELRNELESTFAAGRLATAGTSSRTQKVPSLAQNHAYAVLAYDRATDLITFRDPHGQTFKPKGEPGLESGYVIKHGLFQVPAPEAVLLMAGFAFQTGSGDGSSPAPVSSDPEA